MGMTEETKNKASAEKDEKAIKQKELQATQSEKGTKEKTVKGSAEAATKQTAADSQREQTEKEVAQKKTAVILPLQPRLRSRQRILQTSKISRKPNRRVTLLFSPKKKMPTKQMLTSKQGRFQWHDCKQAK